MSELEFFSLMGILNPNFNTMDLVKILVKILEKNQKELNTCFQQKFAMGSYGVGIGRA
jgi:hypothetical protein